jgi:hypothetical protein
MAMTVKQELEWLEEQIVEVRDSIPDLDSGDAVDQGCRLELEDTKNLLEMTRRDVRWLTSQLIKLGQTLDIDVEEL